MVIWCWRITFEVLLLLTQSRTTNTTTASRVSSRATPTPAPIPDHTLDWELGSGVLTVGFEDSVDFGLVTVGDGELSCDGGLIEGLGVEPGTSPDVVVRDEEGEGEAEP